MRSCIVLAGGYSRRFRRLKPLTPLRGKHLIAHVLEGLTPLVDRILVVVKEVNPRLRSILDSYGVEICGDLLPTQAPLVGLLTGFNHMKDIYTLVSPCDSPFVDPRIVDRLFEEALGFDAAVPMWANGYIEPLHSVYRVSSCLEASRSSVSEGRLSVRSMIARLSKVNYVKAEALGNPKHFLNINTYEKLRLFNAHLTG